MKPFKNIFYTALLLTGASVFAQQDLNQSLYRYTQQIVNPSYAGATEGGSSELGINYRNQWLGVPGAPETQVAFFGTGVGKNVGLGLVAFSDRTFIENTTSFSVDFSYKVKISTKTNLFLGARTSFNSFGINTQGLTIAGLSEDPLLNGLEARFLPNFGAGALLKGDRYFISLSLPRLLNRQRLQQQNNVATLGADRRLFAIAAGYDFDLSKKLTFTPSAQLRYVDAAPLSIELTGTFKFFQKFEAGLGYRIQEGVSGLFLINAANWLDIGYAYEAPLENPINSVTNGTHEIFTKFKF